jgi:hypothetical protein
VHHYKHFIVLSVRENLSYLLSSKEILESGVHAFAQDS